jgi:hypothetical protein
MKNEYEKYVTLSDINEKIILSCYQNALENMEFESFKDLPS